METILLINGVINKIIYIPSYTDKKLIRIKLVIPIIIEYVICSFKVIGLYMGNVAINMLAKRIVLFKKLLNNWWKENMGNKNIFNIR